MLRQRVANFLESRAVNTVIVGVILFNAVILGMETSPVFMTRAGGLILALDAACLCFFVVELLLKFFAYRGSFFRSGWNIFDLIIVVIALVPASDGFSVLRALRIFRVLRLISVAPQLRRVVEGLVTALPGMASVFVLMAIIFYVGAVVATKLFGASFPDWFGSLGGSAYSLFQIMTLESWSMGIVRPVMEVYPHAWMFFVPFIMVTTFAVVNLLVGLIVNSMQDAHAEESNAATDEYRNEILARLKAIEKAMQDKE